MDAILHHLPPLAISQGLTFTLAVIGALTGGLSAAAGVIGAYRDRARLHLDLHWTESIDQGPTFKVSLVNDAPRATTIREVGFYGRDVEATVQRPGEPDFDLSTTVTTKYPLTRDPIFLDPGELVELEREPDDVHWNLPPDQPLRLYVRDARGKYVWGRAAPLVRLFMDAGWEPPEEYAGHVGPPTERLVPAKVEPRWKLWVRRELRNPKAYRWPPV